ncbi:MAG: SDR family oxidoreductase [Gallionellaceae bacterium]|nr:SDR family oxidoreductase [Gallionellaceae bacterium]
MSVLVTGASGFVGGALCEVLSHVDHDVIPAVRCSRTIHNERVVGQIGPDTDWSPALRGIDTAVHLAARVHVMSDKEGNPLAAFRSVNTDGTLNLARQCAVAGVRRFVFISSIKVNGEGRKQPYSESDLALPQDAYAISKWEAEQGLREIESATGMEVVILRPPLVYGPGVGANFLRLMRMVEKRRPLPFGRVENRRSLLYLGNFTDAIRLCLEHPAAAGKTYLLSDGEDVSSADLARRLARAMNRPARLLSVPAFWLRMAGVLSGRSAEIDRLLGSLVVDSSKIRQELGWRPPFSMEDGLGQTVAYFLQHIG